jgi:DNA-binding GntR family transcriptional regulator
VTSKALKMPIGGFVQKSAAKERLIPARAPRRETRPSPVASQSAHLNSLANKTYEGLLAILFSGELRPNDVIMERRIAEQLGISRTPLREAIRRLEGEKLLQRQSGGAIVVCPMSIEDFLDILSLRRLLEGEAARKAAGHISAQELLSFRERIRAVATKAEPDSLAAQELGRELHLCIAKSADNQVLASVIEDMGKRTRLFIRLFMRIADRRAQVCEEHLALIDALLESDGERARACMEQHIDSIRVFVLDKLAAL